MKKSDFSGSAIKREGHRLFSRGPAPVLALVVGLFLALFFLFRLITPRVRKADDIAADKSVPAAVAEPLESQERLEREKRKPEGEGEIKIREEILPRRPFRRGIHQRFFRGRLASVPSGTLITGRMTLFELEAITGIRAREIADELGIPSSDPLHDQLGLLRRRYAFSMQEVRDVVAALAEKETKRIKKETP